EVLDHTGQVAESDIDEFHIVVRNKVDEFFSRREHLGLLVRVRWPFLLTSDNPNRLQMKWWCRSCFGHVSSGCIQDGSSGMGTLTMVSPSVPGSSVPGSTGAPPIDAQNGS